MEKKEGKGKESKEVKKTMQFTEGKDEKKGKRENGKDEKKAADANKAVEAKRVAESKGEDSKVRKDPQFPDAMLAEIKAMESRKEDKQEGAALGMEELSKGPTKKRDFRNIVLIDVSEQLGYTNVAI